MVLGQYGVVLVDIRWYWVSMGRYLVVLGGAGSVWGSTGWYLVVLGLWKAVLGLYKAVRAESIWMSGRKGLK